MLEMRKFWTAEERNLLIGLYPNTPTKEIAQKLNRSEKSVYSQANLLKLTKSFEYMTQERSRQAERLKVVGLAYRIKPGTQPPNRGKKQIEYMTPEAIERTKATRFKKSQVPHNHKPIGHQRISKNGYIEVKVAEPNRLVLLHRWIWKIWNGSIPIGYRIHFKDGDKLNCDINNLELLTPQEAMDRNRITHYPPELQQVIKLKNQLNKKIKNHGKKQNGGLA